LSVKRNGRRKLTDKIQQVKQERYEKIMSLKKKILTGFCSAFAVAALSSFAAAQETPNTVPQEKSKKMERKAGKFGKRGFGRRGGNFGMHEMRGLNLTEEQKTQIRSIIEANRASSVQIDRNEMRQIMEAKRSGTITAEQEARLKSFHEQRRAEAERVREQIMAILTPEQKAQLEKRKQEREQRREQFRQRRQNRTKAEKPTDN
jgi:P pilus assembly/Cpx signaling pathway, periplasmic inhibitor/zinc-resistance associated protein